MKTFMTLKIIELPNYPLTNLISQDVREQQYFFFHELVWKKLEEYVKIKKKDTGPLGF